MSKIIPTNKDHIIDDMDDQYQLSLTEDEYDRLRKLTEAELLFVVLLLARATKSKPASE